MRSMLQVFGISCKANRIRNGVRLALALMSVIVWTGCARDARSLSVNETTARQSLETFLNAWKDGRRETDLAPKIIGKDSDWEDGKILEKFDILPEKRTDGANIFFKVQRTLKSPEGVSLDQEVEYVVGTSPVITVNRFDQ